MSYPIANAAAQDGVLRFLSVSHKTAKKSDAFIFTLDGCVLLQDGGMTECTDAAERLAALRAELCPDRPLKIVWVLSHFHVDHIHAFLESILPNPDFEITDVYLPPHTRVTELCPRSGDEKYREALYAALAKYQWGANIHNLRFADAGGEPLTFDFAGAKITLLPPETDWADDDTIRRVVIDGYYDGEEDAAKIATCVTNAASLWMIVDYKGRRIVLNGDSMKREWKIPDESWDKMCEKWGSLIGTGADLMKWPHHGMRRDPAATRMKAFAPKNILMTTVLATADQVWREKYPEDATPFFNSAEQDLAVTVDSEGKMEIRYV